jgi:hypothetical protein
MNAIAFTRELESAIARSQERQLLATTSDPDEIVELLGGSFKVEDEYHIQGGHTVTVLRGRNRRHAVVTRTAGRYDAVRIFEATLRVVEGGAR